MDRQRVLASIVGCLFSVTLLACGSDAPIPTDAPMPKRLETVDSVLEEATGRGASGVLTIRLREETIYEKGFGSASCMGDDPVTPEHLFMIGSITKEFTRLLIYLLDACQGATWWAFSFWAPAYLVRRDIAPNPDTAALALLPAIVGFVVGTLLGGWLIDRLRRRTEPALVRNRGYEPYRRRSRKRN